MNRNQNYMDRIPAYMITGLLWMIAGILLIVGKSEFFAIIAAVIISISLFIFAPVVLKKPTYQDERTKDMIYKAKSDAMDILVIIIAVMMGLYLLLQEKQQIRISIPLDKLLIAVMLLLFGAGMALIGVRFKAIDYKIMKDADMSE